MRRVCVRVCVLRVRFIHMFPYLCVMLFCVLLSDKHEDNDSIIPVSYPRSLFFLLSLSSFLLYSLPFFLLFSLIPPPPPVSPVLKFRSLVQNRTVLPPPYPYTLTLTPLPSLLPLLPSYPHSYPPQSHTYIPQPINSILPHTHHTPHTPSHTQTHKKPIFLLVLNGYMKGKSVCVYKGAYREKEMHIERKSPQN